MTEAVPTTTAAPEAQVATEVKEKLESTEQKVATPAEIRKMKLKLEGQEVELDEAEVIRRAQKASVAEKRFAEASEMRKQAFDLIQRLKSDPRGVLSDPNIGVDVLKFAEQVVWEKIQDQTLTPEQKKARAQAQELERYREQEKAWKAQQAEQQMAAVRARYVKEYDNKITKALQNSGLPKTPITVKRMTDYMLAALKNGYDADPEDIVPQLREDYSKEHREMYGSLSEEELIKLVGEETMKRIRKADLQRLKATTGKVVGDGSVKVSAPKANTMKKLRGVDWLAEVRREALGK